MLKTLLCAAALSLGTVNAAVCPFTGHVSNGELECPHRKLKAAEDPDVTFKGCTCKTTCGASITTGFANCDWCYTNDSCGRSGLQGSWDYCSYPKSDAYEAQTADQKYDFLWSRITADQNSAAPPQVAGILVESVQTAFDNNKDWMPANRVKYIHPVGTICPFTFSVEASSPYTGIFGANQTTRGFIRMGSALPVTTSSGVTPGLGIKLLRSGVKSGNFVALHTLDPLPNLSYNFFEGNFSNHLPPPSGTLVKLLGQKFKQASGCILQVGLSDISKWDASGKAAPSPAFPYRLHLFSFDVQFPTAPTTMQQLQANMTLIPVGTKLFSIFAFDSPTSAKAGQGQLLGHFTTTDKCVTSHYGDASFFIQHQRVEEDWVLRPEWLSEIDPQAECMADAVTINPPTKCQDE